jgi:hypothetical protein
LLVQIATGTIEQTTRDELCGNTFYHQGKVENTL